MRAALQSIYKQLIDRNMIISVGFREVVMPQRVSCNNCNTILYEGRNIKPPLEVIHNYEGKCPKCGSRFSLIPKRIDVTPITRNRRRKRSIRVRMGEQNET